MKGSDAIGLGIGGLALYALWSKQSQGQSQPTGGGGSYFSLNLPGGGTNIGLPSLGGGDTGLASAFQGVLNTLPGLLNRTTIFPTSLTDITKKTTDQAPDLASVLKSAIEAAQAAANLKKTTQTMTSEVEGEAESLIARLKKAGSGLTETIDKVIHTESPTATTKKAPPSEPEIKPTDEKTIPASLSDWQVGLLGGVRELIGVGARQYAGAFLAGEHIIRPLPIADAVEKLGEMLLPKIAPKGASLAAKIGTRAVPVLGWGLLGVDVIADIVRLFGVDAPEFLGLSPIASMFNSNGENPLETWVARTDKQQKQLDQSTPIPYQLANKQAATPTPEAPQVVSSATQINLTPKEYQRATLIAELTNQQAYTGGDPWGM